MYLTMVYESKSMEELKAIALKDNKSFFYAVTNNAPKFTEDDENIEEVES
jgi:hypothetical protein